jgi:hypothetical protein
VKGAAYPGGYEKAYHPVGEEIQSESLGIPSPLVEKFAWRKVNSLPIGYNRDLKVYYATQP